MTSPLNFFVIQVSNLQRKIEELESEIQSLQDDLILSHRAYEQCKKQLEERESSDDQMETSTLSFQVKERPQQITTLDIDVKPQVTELEINVSPQQSFDYGFTPQTTTTEFEIQPQKPQTTVEYIPEQSITTEFDIIPQTTTTLDIDVQQRHATTELEIDIERRPRPIPVTSWTTGSAQSYQVYRDRKYEPVQFTLEEEEDGEYEIAQIESRSSSRRRWKY